MFKKLTENFRPNTGAAMFFTSILLWGVAFGCFSAVLNNYLADVRSINAFERGVLEFFREMPGLLLVFIIALMHRFSDWKILKIGTLIAMVGIAGLLFTADKLLITALIMIWSTGEHIMMPVRSSITMRIAQDGKLGSALGMIVGAMNAGTVTGSVIAAGIFYLGVHQLQMNQVTLYNIVWGLILVLLACCLAAIILAKGDENVKTKRPALYFHRKYNKFYALELFYGARKQVFITFAPYVLILNYGMSTSTMAILMGICALVNIFCGPLIGRLTDKIGYKNVMIYDTVVLFFVCLIYGYADSLFVKNIAYIVVCLNFLLDAVISTTSMATNVYVRELSDSKEEVTATLSTGISINHLISILAALAGGWIWKTWGTGALFGLAALMAVANSAFALTLPKPGTIRKAG
ncbi:MAG: MFS transporter [Lentisphaeria bacterium]|nr:MFS transporter [Lentisphaeria bacterium]